VFPAGTKVVVLQDAGSYVQVRTEQGLVAYVVTSSIAPIGYSAPRTEAEWTEAPLINDWTNAGPVFNQAGFLRDMQGIVHLRGVIKNLSDAPVAVGSNVFVLPEGYRPPRREVHTIATGHDNTIGRIDIIPDGSVQVVIGDPDLVSLDGITFSAK
jgi:hypothetical protein